MNLLGVLGTVTQDSRGLLSLVLDVLLCSFYLFAFSADPDIELFSLDIISSRGYLSLFELIIDLILFGVEAMGDGLLTDVDHLRESLRVELFQVVHSKFVKEPAESVACKD